MPAFQFKDFGTFTGPNSLFGDYKYESASFEVEPAVGGNPPQWSQDVPVDSSFFLTDLAMVLFHNSADYVGFYSPGTSTSTVTLSHSLGDLPLFMIRSKNTIHTGNIICLDTIMANKLVTCNGPIIANANMTLAGVGDVASNIQLAKSLPAKPFDISHPSKEGHRLRHVSLEGPEIAVYYRGKLKGGNVIELPEYWSNLIDPETITVNLTPVGIYQELFVEKIEWGRTIIIKNREGGPINCHYTVYAERKDMEKLIVEYEGESPKDYPGQDWLNLKEN